VQFANALLSSAFAYNFSLWNRWSVYLLLRSGGEPCTNIELLYTGLIWQQDFIHAVGTVVPLADQTAAFAEAFQTAPTHTDSNPEPFKYTKINARHLARPGMRSYVCSNVYNFFAYSCITIVQRRRVQRMAAGLSLAPSSDTLKLLLSNRA
jgi:hypothetical protein